MSDTTKPGGHPALTDAETGLPNRLHFDTVFRVVFSTGDRGVPISVLVLEIQDFRAWSDGMGPEKSANALRVLGGVLQPLVRDSDLLSRAAEDRFFLGLIDCNLAGAILVADRIDTALHPIRESTGMDFNLGGAVFDMDMDRPEDLLSAAEEALRKARSKGVNQTEFHL